MSTKRRCHGVCHHQLVIRILKTLDHISKRRLDRLHESELTRCKLPTTSSKLGAKALLMYRKTLSVSLHLSFRLRYRTTSSNRLAAVILQTSWANAGAEPTALKRMTTFSLGGKNPALARAAVASWGRSDRIADAVIVSGSSGDSGRKASGSGMGGESVGEGWSGNSMMMGVGLLFQR